MDKQPPGRASGRGGPGFAFAGAGLGLGTWVAEQAGLRLPTWLLIPVGAVAVGMFLYGLVLLARDHLLARRAIPKALRDEVKAIRRELVRFDNRRQINGGSIWPIKRPYCDLPSEQWEAFGEGHRLKKEDRRAVKSAYALLARFNDEMLHGETIIASTASQEPDLDGLRAAFDDVAARLGLPAIQGSVPSAPSEPVAREFRRRDDPGELAQRCHMLAGSVERWIERYRRNQSETVEKMVEEGLAAEPDLDAAETRRRAYDLYDKNWETDYRLKYEIEAGKLFDQAYELGEIAKEHRRLALAPLAIEFERVPQLFSEIADSIYAQAA